jgi:cell division protein FtsQ
MSRRTGPPEASATRAASARGRRATRAGGRSAASDQAAMDRRLIDRRLDILRSGGRRRRRVAGLLLVAGGLGIVTWQLAGSSLFELTGVAVSGNRALSSSEVVAASGVRVGEQVLRLDTDAVRARVERLPYVAHATVVRVPPAGLRIEVTERVPAATVADGNASWLVAADGTVLARSQAATPTLPHVRAVPPPRPRAGLRYEADSPLANALAALEGMDPQLRRLVGGIEAPSVEGLRFTLGDGAVLLYGRAERQAAKDAAALLLLRDARVGRKEVDKVDVRAPGTPVLVARNAAAGAP